MAQRILVVEDLPDWQTTLGNILNAAGYAVDYAASPTDAMLALGRSRYDLALLDIRLDESRENDDGGLLLADQISKQWPELKIIFVTGYPTQEFVARAMSPVIGGGKRLAVNFVTKDHIDNLVEIVRQTLN